MKAAVGLLVSVLLLFAASPTWAEPTASESRTDITLGSGLHKVSVSGHDVTLRSFDLNARYARRSGHGATLRAFFTAESYGFGALDVGYLYRVRLLGSETTRLVLDLMAGPSVADANGCDDYDDPLDEPCAGPNLHGAQLGGFVSPSLSVHLGHFRVGTALTYRRLRQVRYETRNTSFRGLTVGLGFVFY